jgi:hypothetical protein
MTRMTTSDLNEDVAYQSKVMRVRSPNGTLFLTIVEDNNGLPLRAIVQVGKTGTDVRAWADAIGRLMSRLLQYGYGIELLISELSNIHSDSLVYTDNPEMMIIKSGPDALVQALLDYQRDRYNSMKKLHKIRRTASFDYED